MKSRKRSRWLVNTSVLYGSLLPYLMIQGVFALALFFLAGDKRSILLLILLVSVPLFALSQVIFLRQRKKSRDSSASRGRENILTLISLAGNLAKTVQIFLDSCLLPASSNGSGGAGDPEKSSRDILGGLVESLREIGDQLRSSPPDSQGDPAGWLGSLDRFLPDSVGGLSGLSEEVTGLRKKMDILVKENEAVLAAASAMLYEINHSLPAVEKLADSSGQYEKKTISSILKQFEQIWDYSKELVEDSGQTISRFSRGESGEERSLSYIGEKNEFITAKVEEFVALVGGLEKAANQFLESAVGGLEAIRSTAGVIEDMAERIKVISINVRIEAARIAGQHSGFHILGQEITAFADQTAQFAQTTNRQIEQTFQQIQPLRDELLEDLSQVRTDMDGIRSAMAPYKEIIDGTFINLDKVIHNLNELSLNITSKMKNTIGQLQFHDIINQETEHIIEFLKMLESSCRERGSIGFSGQVLDDEAKMAIKRAIIEDLSSLMTTGNERLVIEALRKEMGLEESVEPELDLSKSQVLDENTILF